MSERKRRFFSGPSLEAALVGAASEYGIPPEEVSYRVVEKRHGFLKIRRNTVIEVDPDAPRKSEAEAPRGATKASKKAAAETADKAASPPREAKPSRVEAVADTENAATEDEVAEVAEAGEAHEEEERPPLRPRSRARVQEGGRPTPERSETRGRERESREDRKPESRRRDRRREEPEKSRREEDVGRGGPRPESARRRPRLEPPKPIEERLEKARGEKAEAALEATEWLLDLVDLDVDPEIYLGEDRFEVELRGRDRARLTPDNGKVLSALEHLIPRVMRGVCGDTHPVRVDSENYQALREDRLRELAWDTADKVRREGQATILEAMDPADRRIVHIAVSDDPDVTTRSLGDGFFKRVKVLPK